MSKTVNNKRIVKNTFLLYIRQLFILLITLYTSRVVLNVLGVTDYGIYNVVGGIVTMLSFLNSTMAAATQRFISFEMGLGEMNRLKTVFSTSLQIHAIISVVIVLFAESLGLWLLYNKLQIPTDRMFAAQIVFQCSILSMVFSVMSVPYNAVIIAHEKMSAFAYISILEVLLKLLTVLVLTWCNTDKLSLYAILLLIVYITIRICYSTYCNKHFPESKYIHTLNKALMKEMFAFAGWNTLPNIVAMLNTQGLNIILNIFYGPAINAARGIAVQVQTAANQFVTNLQMAINPQMTKSYAAGDYLNTNVLLMRCSLFSFYLLLIITLPMFYETQMILSLWLINVPEYTVIFVRILLCCILLWTFSSPMNTVAYSTGKIRNLNIIHSLILILALPVSWGLLKHGGQPYFPFIVVFFLEVISQIIRMFILRSVYPSFSIKKYCYSVYFRALVVLCISIIVPTAMQTILPKGFVCNLIVCISAFASASITTYKCGMTKAEQEFVKNKILKKLIHH